MAVHKPCPRLHSLCRPFGCQYLNLIRILTIATVGHSDIGSFHSYLSDKCDNSSCSRIQDSSERLRGRLGQLNWCCAEFFHGQSLERRKHWRTRTWIGLYRNAESNWTETVYSCPSEAQRARHEGTGPERGSPPRGLLGYVESKTGLTRRFTDKQVWTGREIW